MGKAAADYVRKYGIVTAIESDVVGGGSPSAPVDVMDFGVVVGPVTYAQAENNLAAINKAADKAIERGATELRFPPGEIGVRRVSGNDGTKIEESAIVFRSGLAFVGAGKDRTTIKRYGPNTPFNMRPEDFVKGASLRSMTVDGNPGIDGYTKYASNLAYFENATGIVVDDVRFLDVPGLHALDVNGVESMLISRCEFVGYDISLRGSDATYYPESVQIGMNQDRSRVTKNVRIIGCSAGASATYQAPLVCVGNHTGHGGGPSHAAEDVVIEDFIASGIDKHMFRPKAWRGVSIIRSKLLSGAARFCYVDNKPAYPEAGTGFAACEDILIKDCVSSGLGEFLYANTMSTTEDPGVRHRNIRVVGGTVNGNDAVNAISLNYCSGVRIDALKARGSRRHVSLAWSEGVEIVNPDFDGALVNGIEVADPAGFGNGKGFNKGVRITGGRITGTRGFHGISLAAVNGYHIENVDLSGSSLDDGTKTAVTLSSNTSNGKLVDLYSRGDGYAFIPTNGINITGGANNEVINCALVSSGDMLRHFGTGKSVERRSVYTVAAMPTSGHYRAGDVAFPSAPAVGQPRGWTRLTTGTTHVLGTDWVSHGNL